MSTKNTRASILECAQELLQKRGYHAWSYQDVASVVGIRKASIHYYFPFKEDLGQALVTAYQDQLRGAFEKIDKQSNSPKERIQGLIQLMGSVLKDPQMYCLCGMLAADYPTLDEKVQKELLATFRFFEDWVCQILKEGEEKGLWHFKSGAKLMARTLLASLEGMLLLSRMHGGQTDFLAMAENHLFNVLNL